MAVGITAEVRALLRMRMGRGPRADVVGWASPLIDAYFDGFATVDYVRAAAGFSPSLRESFPEEEFMAQRRTVLEAVGSYHSHAIQAVHRQGRFVMVIVLVFFEFERK